VDLIFCDPQYEKASDVSRIKDWPLHYQSDYQIVKLLKEIQRVLKPSSFCLLWINKNILSTDRVQLWLLSAPNLKIVDLLVWKKNNFGFGSYFRVNSEFAFLLQKYPVIEVYLMFERKKVYRLKPESIPIKNRGS